MPPHFEHLLVRLVHLDQVVCRSFVLDLHFLQLAQYCLGIFQGYFVGVHFLVCFFVLAGELLGARRCDKLVDV